MQLERKTFPFEVKAVEKSGTFSGYLSVFGNTDWYGDIVMPGAFKKSLETWKKKDRLPPILWQHWSDDPIGPFTKMQEDDVGLYVEGQLLIDDVQRAREAHALLKNKVISGMSIGFAIDKYEVDEKEQVRRLTEIDLWEGSIVTFPANEEAQVEAVKSLLRHGDLPDLKTFERFLREAGFSKSQATAVAGQGLAHLLRREAAGTGEDQAREVLDELKNSLTQWRFK